jgi:pyruvate/2-oxoacid:ferredoxin oxidoreductase beta subunit
MSTGTLTWAGVEVPREEYLHPGHLACQGCGAALAMRLVLKAMGGDAMVVLPACCWTIIDGPFPYHALKVPLLHTAFETAAAAAAGVKAGLEVLGDTRTQVIAWAGDGGTFDIGLQALSGAAERNEDILYVCYDNEAYMNTGIQRSSATPLGAWTTTTPEAHPEDRPKKDLMAIMAAHRIPYAATATVAFPDDLIRKVRKARGIKGTRLIHILAPCPPGWRMESELMIKVSRLAVATGAFPLFEVEGGTRYTVTYRPAQVPLKEYLKLQGRFAHLTEDQIATLEQLVKARWQELLDLHARTHGQAEEIPVVPIGG